MCARGAGGEPGYEATPARLVGLLILYTVNFGQVHTPCLLPESASACIANYLLQVMFWEIVGSVNSIINNNQGFMCVLRGIIKVMKVRGVGSFSPVPHCR